MKPGPYEKFILKNPDVWGITVNRRSIGTFHLASCLLQASFLVSLLFSLEDEADMFLRNAGSVSTD
jgi:hypothetical protein